MLGVGHIVQKNVASILLTNVAQQDMLFIVGSRRKKKRMP